MNRHSRGFTLVELIVSITLVGILSVVAVPMVRTPMQAYMDATLRAELSAQLDASVARMRDDLALAMPNSVRVRNIGARYFVEFLPMRASGRYRSATTTTLCPNDKLEFGLATEGCFTTLGPLQMRSALVPGSDWVVVNPFNPAGTVGQNPYFGGATAPPDGVKSRLLTFTPGASENRITITPHRFLNEPVNHQFYIVSNPVSYECNPATRRLTRYEGYAIAAAQPSVFPAASAAPLATVIGDCQIRYTPTPAPGGRGGVVSVWLQYRLPSAGSRPPETIESFSAISVREPV
jgi:MSHA biogenesis protein MshO